MRKTLKNIVGGAILGVGSLFLPSCETMNMADIWAFNFAMMQRDPNLTPDQKGVAAILGSIAQRQAEYQREKEIAEAGKTEIEVNVNVQTQGQTPFELRKFFACNSFVDSNRNGFCDYPNEFIGRKMDFKVNEDLFLVNYDKSSEKGEYTLNIYDTYGKLILENTIGNEGGNVMMTGGNFLAPTIVNKGRYYGLYRAAWFLNKNFLGEIEFTISPSQ